MSEQRWFWAVLTAFLVFVNTQSRGDAVLRSLDRAIGTAAGIVVGIGVAMLLQGAVVGLGRPHRRLRLRRLLSRPGLLRTR